MRTTSAGPHHTVRPSLCPTMSARGDRRAAVPPVLLMAAIGALAGCTAEGRRERAVDDVRRSLRATVYAADQHQMATGSYAGFLAPPGHAGVTVYVTDVAAKGIRAKATHRRFPDDLECEVGIGPLTPVGVPEGEPGGTYCK